MLRKSTISKFQHKNQRKCLIGTPWDPLWDPSPIWGAPGPFWRPSGTTPGSLRRGIGDPKSTPDQKHCTNISQQVKRCLSSSSKICGRERRGPSSDFSPGSAAEGAALSNPPTPRDEGARRVGQQGNKGKKRDSLKIIVRN